MKSTRYLFMIIILCLVTCKKKDTEVIVLPSDNIIIGSGTHFFITVFDTVLMGSYHVLKYLEIDVNGDNIADFKFTSEIWGSPGMGQNPRTTLSCLNSNCMITGFKITDTTFLNKVTDTFIGTNKVDIYEYFNYTCKRISAGDSVVNILPEQFKIVSKQKGEYLSKTDLFNSGTVNLTDDAFSSGSHTIFHGDTTIFQIYSDNHDCYTFPSNEICYIGFKMKNNDAEKLGWIRISISGKYIISIIESAIQK